MFFVKTENHSLKNLNNIQLKLKNMQVKNLITYTLKLKNIRVQLNNIQAETEKHTHSIQGNT